MGLINYLGESKVIKKICELLNVKDVKVNGSSVVDSSGDASITVPVNTSDLNNDSGFIDNTVNNLANYYLKSETYTQAEVNALIGSVTTISFLVVQELPTTGQNNIIYLVPKNPAQTDNIYDEYIYINNDWEKIGDTEIDLSNYYTKTQTDNIIAGLDGSVTGTPSASKTLTSFSETDGVVSATFGDISITKSQVSDYTDENVKQELIDDTSSHTIPLSKTYSPSTQTDTLEKSLGLSFINSPLGTTSADGKAYLVVGNNKTSGVADNYKGYLRLYDTNSYKIDVLTDDLTANRGQKFQNKDGTLALLTDIPTDVTKVKQVPTVTSDNKGYRLLVSRTNDNNEETDSVRKAIGFTYNPSTSFTQITRQHTGTGTLGTTFTLGNDIADGTAGATFGAIRLYSKGIYQINLWDRFNSISANRNITFPNANGALALRDDLTRNKLDSNWNLWSSPCYTGDNTGSGITYVQGENSVTFTGTATSQLTYYVRRYSEEWTLPAGKYRLTGCPSGGGSLSYRLRVGADTRNTTTTWLGYDEGNGYEFTLTEEKIITITFNIYNGYAIQDKLVVTPTLVRLDGGWVELPQNTTISASTFSELRVVFNILNTQTSTKYIAEISLLSCAIPVLNVPDNIYSTTVGASGEVRAYFNAHKMANAITIENFSLGVATPSNYSFSTTIYGKI